MIQVRHLDPLLVPSRNPSVLLLSAFPGSFTVSVPSGDAPERRVEKYLGMCLLS